MTPLTNYEHCEFNDHIYKRVQLNIYVYICEVLQEKAPAYFTFSTAQYFQLSYKKYHTRTK